MRLSILRNSVCSNIGQTYINGLLEDTRCSQINLNTEISDVLNAICSVKADGEFCSLDADGFVRDADSRVISLLYSNCDLELNNSSIICRPTCRDTLVEAKTTLDCCINLLNESNSVYYVDTPLLSYNFWKSCGVETPGFCERTFKLTLDATTSMVQTTTQVHNHAASIYHTYQTYLQLYAEPQLLITTLVTVMIHFIHNLGL